MNKTNDDNLDILKLDPKSKREKWIKEHNLRVETPPLSQEKIEKNKEPVKYIAPKHTAKRTKKKLNKAHAAILASTVVGLGFLGTSIAGAIKQSFEPTSHFYEEDLNLMENLTEHTYENEVAKFIKQAPEIEQQVTTYIVLRDKENRSALEEQAFNNSITYIVENRSTINDISLTLYKDSIRSGMDDKAYIDNIKDSIHILGNKVLSENDHNQIDITITYLKNYDFVKYRFHEDDIPKELAVGINTLAKSSSLSNNISLSDYPEAAEILVENLNNANHFSNLKLEITNDTIDIVDEKEKNANTISSSNKEMIQEDDEMER